MRSSKKSMPSRWLRGSFILSTSVIRARLLFDKSGGAICWMPLCKWMTRKTLTRWRDTSAMNISMSCIVASGNLIMIATIGLPEMTCSSMATIPSLTWLSIASLTRHLGPLAKRRTVRNICRMKISSFSCFPKKTRRMKFLSAIGSPVWMLTAMENWIIWRCGRFMPFSCIGCNVWGTKLFPLKVSRE